MTAVNEATGEVKYLVTNAVGESLATILEVAFRRATVDWQFTAPDARVKRKRLYPSIQDGCLDSPGRS